MLDETGRPLHWKDAMGKRLAFAEYFILPTMRKRHHFGNPFSSFSLKLAVVPCSSHYQGNRYKLI